MVITEQQAEVMVELAAPLISWMQNNCNPHCTALVNSTSIELTESIAKEVFYDNEHNNRRVEP